MSSSLINKKQEDKEIDLLQLFYIALNNYKFIALTTLIITLLGIGYALLATPIYRADALIQVESKGNSTALSNLSEMLMADGQSKSAKEIEIIKSRMVVGETVQTLGLDIDIQPRLSWWHKIFASGDLPSIEGKFELPDSLIGEELELQFNDKKYSLEQEGDVLLTGEIGKLAENKTGIKIFITKVNGDSQSFKLEKNNTLLTITAITNVLQVKDRGKDTGILELSYTSSDPQLAQKILNSISNNYVRQNVEYTSKQVSKSLQFLQQQLPQIVQQLTEAENKLNAYRQKNKSFDLSHEAKALLDHVVKIDEQINQLKLKEKELNKSYTVNHPVYKTLLNQLAVLMQQKNRIENNIVKLPQSQQSILNLEREVSINNNIYVQLLSQQQELKIAKASTIGNVRVIDSAETQPKPIKPRKKLIVIVVFMFGLLVSTGLVVVKYLLRNRLDSVNQIEELGLQTYASVPESKWQVENTINVARFKFGPKEKKSYRLLAQENPEDLAVEALRGLRTSLYFAMLEAQNNLVTISGCTPGVGKSFTTSNLAVICAQAGKKVLLIDGDMRRGYLHRIFKGAKRLGLADYLLKNLSLDDVIEQTKTNNLFFISGGNKPSNPSELLMHSRFEQFLQQVQKEFDIVLLDTPPILAVTDPLIMAKHAGSLLLIVKYGENSPMELKEAVKRFRHNQIKVTGVVLNAVKQKRGYYYQYGYEYKGK